MAKVLSAPGKTFLVGEYLALVGGPSVLVSTSPRFQLTAEDVESQGPAVSPFAPGSPAGKFLSRHERDFRDYRLSFEDPHAGAGGLGASSAQWALLYALKYGIQDKPDWAAILEEYRQCAWSGEGVAPSGADVVSQFHGGITCFDGREFQARGLEWNFANLSFSLLRTGVKLATHEHLKRHQAAPQEILRACVNEMIAALETKNEELAVGAVARTAAALLESGRTAGHTLDLLTRLQKEPWVRGAKGCGAMGADFVLVLHDLSAAKSMAAWATSQGLEIGGGLPDLDRGLRFEV
jgi:mevalonate kinase